MSEFKKTTKKAVIQRAKKNNAIQKKKVAFSKPANDISMLQKSVGNQAVQRLMKSGVIQAKLTIGQPNDKYEQEADKVADEIMRMPEPNIQTKPRAEQVTPLVQRQSKTEEEELLQTKSTGETLQVTSSLESKINALEGGGEALSKETRAFFEPRFGKDFSKVRVHNNANAHQLAQSINAKAFTRGNNVVFGNGEYSPNSSSGKRLLGHELTHTIQQNQSKSKFINNKVIQRQSSDYQHNIIPNSLTQFADNKGNIAQNTNSVYILPTLNIPLDYATKRQNYFRNQILFHFNKGIILHHDIDSLRKTYVFHSMKKQLDGYIKDVPVLTMANNAYNMFVPNANLALKGMLRHFTLQDILGFENNTNFEKQLTSKQKKELHKTIKNNPELLNHSNSVRQKQQELKAARTMLHAHLQGYEAIIINITMKERKKTVTKNKAEQKKINDKISKITRIASYIQTAITLAASGTKALTSTSTSSRITFDNANKGVGILSKTISISMQLYHAKELRQFQSKIYQAIDELRTLKELASVHELESKLLKLNGIKETYINAIKAYENAIQDRRLHMIAIATQTDKTLLGKKYLNGVKTKQDFISQTLLYMTSVRENRSLIQNAIDSGLTAKKVLKQANFQLYSHRNTGYQTNRLAYTSKKIFENEGPDWRVLKKMDKLTIEWIKKASYEKFFLEKQNSSAKRLMQKMGRGGDY